MTSEERKELKDLVRESCQEAIHEQLPEQLTEELTALLAPEIRRTVRSSIKPFRTAMIAAYTLLCVAVVLLYIANRHRAQEIQDQRQESVLRSCKEQNLKHDNTIKTIDLQLAPRIEKADERQKAALKDRRDQTVLIIDALTPKRDCKKLAKAAVTEEGK